MLTGGHKQKGSVYVLQQAEEEGIEAVSALLQLGKLSHVDLEVEHGLGVGAYGTQGGGQRQKLSGLQRENDVLARQPQSTYCHYSVCPAFIDLGNQHVLSDTVGKRHQTK